MDEFARPTAIDMHGEGYGVARYGSEQNINVMFYTRSVYNEAKSREAGTQIHENRVYVKMFQPGERLNVVDRPASKDDQNRFPEHWNRYLNNRTQVPEGTPIELLFPNNPAIADNLRVQGVHTIQQCAKLTQTGIDTIGMGAQEYVNRAKQYIDSATSSIEFNKLREENEKKDLTIQRMHKDMATMRQQLDALIKQAKNPVQFSVTNPVVGGADIQAERINSRHISTEVATRQVADSAIDHDSLGLMAPTIERTEDELYNLTPATPITKKRR